MVKIMYEGQEYPVDETEVKSGEDAVDWLVRITERAVGSDVETEKKDGDTIYWVTARAQGKGGLRALIAVMRRVDNYVQPAIRMAGELKNMDEFQILQERKRIRAAYEAGAREFDEMQRVLKRISDIPPVCAETVPTGF